MDLLIIPVSLLLGGTLLYLGVHGMPRLSYSYLPKMPERMPFDLMDWLKERASNLEARPRTRAAHDAELVDLMNEMIAVREQLTTLKLSMETPEAPRQRRTSRSRTETRKPAATEPARRQYSGANRRYVRT